MDKKKILIVSKFFFPVITPRAFRTTELVKEFARQGHKVTLYTLKDQKLHPDFEKQFNVTIKDLGPLTFKPIEIGGSHWTSKIKRGLRRLMQLALEYPDIEFVFNISKALKAERNYDLLISVAVPHAIHWGIARITKAHRIAKIWVADCGDPYMGDRTDSFKKLFYFKYVEKWFCKKADYISIPIESAKVGYYPEFHEKLRVIPQGFNFEELDLATGENRENPVPTFGYAGGFIPGKRDPRVFLDFLVSQPQNYKFIIYSNSRNIIEKYVDASRGRIELRSYIPRKQLLHQLSQMDFLVNFSNGTEVQLPSKLIDYALTQRPILSIEPGRIDTKLVDEFLHGNFQKQFQIGDIEKYNIENVTKQFLELLPQAGE